MPWIDDVHRSHDRRQDLALRRIDLLIQALVDVPFPRRGVERRAVLEFHALPQGEHDALAVRRGVPALRQLGLDGEVRLVFHQRIERQIQDVAFGVLDREDRVIGLGIVGQTDRQRAAARWRLRPRDPSRQHSARQTRQRLTTSNETIQHRCLPPFI